MGKKKCSTKKRPAKKRITLRDILKELEKQTALLEKIT